MSFAVACSNICSELTASVLTNKQLMKRAKPLLLGGTVKPGFEDVLQTFELVSVELHHLVVHIRRIFDDNSGTVSPQFSI